MAKRSLEKVKLARLEARMRFLRVTVHFTFLAFCLSAGFVVFASGYPQLRHLQDLEGKLVIAQQREEEVLADLEYHQIEHRALKNDPTFLEIHARDRLNFYREGERVLKFAKDP
jgi:hypothetical protein